MILCEVVTNKCFFFQESFRISYESESQSYFIIDYDNTFFISNDRLIFNSVVHFFVCFCFFYLREGRGELKQYFSGQKLKNFCKKFFSDY